MRIYFAGPLFCRSEQAFNSKLAGKLEGLGFTVFLPQRDGVEGAKPLYTEMAMEEVKELRQTIFAVDRDEVLKADIFLFILDGRVPDDGACVELGIAYTQKFLLKRDKLIIGLHTDMRGAFAFLNTKLNPMISGCFDDIVENENALLAVLEKYQQVNQV